MKGGPVTDRQNNCFFQPINSFHQIFVEINIYTSSHVVSILDQHAYRVTTAHSFTTQLVDHEWSKASKNITDRESS